MKGKVPTEDTLQRKNFQLATWCRVIEGGRVSDQPFVQSWWVAFFSAFVFFFDGFGLDTTSNRRKYFGGMEKKPREELSPMC